MDPKVVFLLGSLGALAPEIVRLYSIRNNPEEFSWSWFYLIVSAVFALLGGVVALILPATTYWGALYVGATTPVLITTALKKGLDSDKTLKHHEVATSQASPLPVSLGAFLKGL